MLSITNSFLKGLEEIKDQIDRTESNVLEDVDYFQDQVNFFSKAILITICSHFEAFSKELIKHIIDHYSLKIRSANVPSNLIYWDIQKTEYKTKDRDTKINYNLSIDEETIDSNISANPYRVRDCFEKCGIKLTDYNFFNENIEILNFLVNKRNHIIHYNKDSSDISLGDLKYYLETVKNMIFCINDAVENRIN